MREDCCQKKFSRMIKGVESTLFLEGPPKAGSNLTLTGCKPQEERNRSNRFEKSGRAK